VQPVINCGYENRRKYWYLDHILPVLLQDPVTIFSFQEMKLLLEIFSFCGWNPSLREQTPLPSFIFTRRLLWNPYYGNSYQDVELLFSRVSHHYADRIILLLILFRRNEETIRTNCYAWAVTFFPVVLFYSVAQSDFNFWLCGWNPREWGFKWKLPSSSFL